MKTIGYIVQCGRVGVMQLAYETPDDKTGLLFFGTYATLFKSRRLARRAIEHTIRERPTFEQECGKLLIMRVEATEQDVGKG